MSLLRRNGMLIYGGVAYAVFLVSFVYSVGFLGGFLAPTQLDAPAEGAVAAAMAIDLGLLGLFALQHSGMARPTFKRWWTRIVPVPIERSTYVLLSSLALLLVFWQWRPIGGVLWNVESLAGRVALYGLFATGWLIVLFATFLINHFDLFGLRQVWLHARDQPIRPLRFATPVLYQVVRHPLYVGWLLVFWSTPRMTASHLVFALATTAYILIAIRLEERNLQEVHPEYAAYRQRVPMLIPRLSMRRHSLQPTQVPDVTPAPRMAALMADEPA